MSADRAAPSADAAGMPPGSGARLAGLAALRARQPGHSLARVLWWHLLHAICFFWFMPAYRYRSWGLHNIPRQGPVLLVSNHQSFLDPIAVGLGAHHRQFYALARSTLWKTPVLGPLMESLNALPVAQGEGDIKAMRQCIDVLKQGHALLVFPEGSRTLDGRTQPFETGTMLLVKRARPMVVPVALEGTFSIWRRGRRVPRPWGRVGVMYGPAIDPQTLLDMKPDAAREHLRSTVETMRLQVARRLH